MNNFMEQNRALNNNYKANTQFNNKNDLQDFSNFSIERHFKQVREENEKRQQKNAMETESYYLQKQNRALNNNDMVNPQFSDKNDLQDFSNFSIEHHFKQVREENEKRRQKKALQTESFHLQEQNRALNNNYMVKTQFNNKNDLQDFANSSIENHSIHVGKKNEKKQPTDFIETGTFHSQEKNTVRHNPKPALIPEENHLYYKKNGENIQQKSSQTFRSDMNFSNEAIERHFKNLKLENEKKLKEGIK